LTEHYGLLMVLIKHCGMLMVLIKHGT